MKQHKRFEMDRHLILMGRMIGKDTAAKSVVAEAEGYVFCQPVRNSPVVTVPLLIETAERAVQKRLDESATRVWWDALRKAAYKKQSTIKGLFVGRRRDEAPTVERDMSHALTYKPLRRINEIYSAVKMPSRYMAHVRLHLTRLLVVDAYTPRQDQIHAVVTAFRAGYIPLYWHGRYPTGHLEVYCPPDRSQASAGTVEGVTFHRAASRKAAVRSQALEREHQRHPGYRDAEAVVADHRPRWKRLVTRSGAGAKVEEHFAPITLTRADRAALELIVSRVEQVAVSGGKLAISVRDDEGSLLVLRCAPPWNHVLTRVPKDLAVLLRLHNGMLLDEPSDTPEVFSWNGTGFTLGRELAGMVKQERVFREEPWTVAPLLVPLTNGQDLYAYLPIDPGPQGRVRLVEISHEATTNQTDTKSGAGGLFLRLVANRLAGSKSW